LQSLALALQQQGAQVQVVALQYPFSAQPYSWNNIPVYPCNGQNRWYWRWRTQKRALRYIADLVPQTEHPFLHSFWLGQAWRIGKKAGRLLRVPYATTLMGQDILPEKNRYWLAQLSPNDAQALIALSDFQAQQWQQLHGSAVSEVIPFGTFSTLSSTDSSPKRLNRVVGIGAFLPVKNWSLWLQVVQQVAAQSPDCQFTLIGAGPLKRQLQHEAQLLGIIHRIEWIPQLDNASLLAYLRQSAVLLHTSRFEGFSMVMAEAVATGCRVVSTPVGIAVQVGFTGTTASALSQAVLNALADPTFAMPTALFTAEQSAQRYLDYWQARTFAP
jgi:glycosyltransferase involved in cell wall biosynthesis